MKTISTRNLKGLLQSLLLTAASFGFQQANAQERAYQNIYSNTIQGDFEMIGNTVLARKNNNGTFHSDMNSNTTGNDVNMQNVDVDNVSSTRNSSMAKLTLPAGSTVLFARVYWGGRANDADYNMNNSANRQIKFRKGTGGYNTITAAQVDIVDRGSYVQYQAWAPLSLTGDPNGEYWAADLPVSTGDFSGSGAYGAWSLLVVYTNNTLPYKSVRVYDGYQQVYSDGDPVTSTINLSGLSIPTGTGSEARMATLVWEGDGDLTGDYIKINGTKFSDALNPANNPFNGTISYKGAVRPSDSRNPYFANQMSIDIDQIDASPYIPTGASSVSFEFFTEADSYFPSIFAFSSRSLAPTITLDKTVTSSIAPFNLLNPNELLTYTLSGSNSGGSPVNNCFITDTIPFGLTYEPGTIKILTNSAGAFTGTATDAANDDIAVYAGNGTTVKRHIKVFIGAGATATAGGTLNAGDSYSMTFQCRTPANATAINYVSNTARIQGAVGSVQYVDDGTAEMGPPGITLAVKLTGFEVTRNGNFADLKWTTAGELKNDRFEIERSTDGISFSKVGTVVGSGTTNEEKNYQFSDALPANATIVYYQLRIIDIDAKSTFSKIVAVRVSGNAALKSYTVYPNPFISDIKLQLNSTRETTVTVRILSVTGQQELLRNVPVQPGNNVVVIKDLDNLKAGLHLMEIISEDGKITQKILKK